MNELQKYIYRVIVSIINTPGIDQFFEEDNESSLSNSFVSNKILDENNNPVKDVVVAVLNNGNLLGKDISNDNGEFSVDFESSTVEVLFDDNNLTSEKVVSSSTKQAKPI